MKKYLATLVTLVFSTATLGMSTPASAQPTNQSSLAQPLRWSIGPSLLLGNGQTAIGIDSKFGISDNLSLRPFVYFASSGTDFGTAITYDFPFRNTNNNLVITPFVGVSVDVNTGGNGITTGGLTGGADVDLSDSLRLKAAVIVPLSSDRGQTTGVTLGAGFRF